MTTYLVTAEKAKAIFYAQSCSCPCIFFQLYFNGKRVDIYFTIKPPEKSKDREVLKYQTMEEPETSPTCQRTLRQPTD